MKHLIGSLKGALIALAFLLLYNLVRYLIWGVWKDNGRDFAVMFVICFFGIYFFGGEEKKEK